MTDERIARAMALLDAHPDVPAPIDEDDDVPILSIVLNLLGIPHETLGSNIPIQPRPACDRK